MERYKGYKIPISAVKVGSLLDKLDAMKQTALAGVIESAASTSEKSTDAAVYSEEYDPTDLLAALDKAIGLTQSEEAIEEAEAFEDDEADAAPAKPERKGRKPKTLLGLTEGAQDGGGRTSEEAKFQNSFIDLTKLLPPLPKKGNFEVNTIKKSLYFFS
jgi:DNA-directed RNA polymerase